MNHNSVCRALSCPVHNSSASLLSFCFFLAHILNLLIFPSTVRAILSKPLQLSHKPRRHVPITPHRRCVQSPGSSSISRPQTRWRRRRRGRGNNSFSTPSSPPPLFNLTWLPQPHLPLPFPSHTHTPKCTQRRIPHAWLIISRQIQIHESIKIL